MNIRIFNTFFLIIPALLLLQLHSAQPSATYTYVVKVDYDTHDPVCLKGTYKGSVIDLRDGIAFLQETERTHSFELIVTSEHPKVSQGAIPHLQRVADISCDWYEISWSIEDKHINWTIKKRDEESLPTRIPHNALIVCYPPEFVEKIESKTIQESSANVVHIPTIILKKDLSTEEKTRRDDALTRSVLAHLDVSNCLSTAPELVKQGNKVRLARRHA